MLNFRIGLCVACILAGSMIVPAGAAPMADCKALLKALADAQTAYNKAFAAFNKAARDLDIAEADVTKAEKAIDRNTADQQKAKASVAEATAQLEACHKRSPNYACTLQEEKKVAAEEYLATLPAERKRFDDDLQRAKDLVEYREDLLAIARAEAEQAKGALDKAKAAAAGCKRAG
jgi:chromosome segregation ATPase